MMRVGDALALSEVLPLKLTVGELASTYVSAIDAKVRVSVGCACARMRWWLSVERSAPRAKAATARRASRWYRPEFIVHESTETCASATFADGWISAPTLVATCHVRPMRASRCRASHARRRSGC